LILLSISLFFACYRYCGAPQSAVRRNKITKKTLPFSCWAASFLFLEAHWGSYGYAYLWLPDRKHVKKPQLLRNPVVRC
jgi:hypothetical protein